jgi:hypothetical protein
MKWWSAEALHFDSEGPNDQKSSGLLLFIWTVVRYPNEAQHFKNFKPSSGTT